MDIQVLRTPEFWRNINPFLTITEQGSNHPLTPYTFSKEVQKSTYNDLCKEGYSKLYDFLPHDEVQKLREGIDNLRAAGLHPCFTFVYDEYWNVYRKMQPLLEGFLGKDYIQLPEFWTWYVDKDKEESGWGPHRDREGQSIFSDGTPKGVTLWIPLTDVTALNGCIHVIPASKDIHYFDFIPSNKGEVYDTSLGHPLEASSGSILMWNSRLIHWGGKSSSKASVSRISMAFEFQRIDVPLFTKPPLQDPQALYPFLKRLHLIANQIRQYDHWGLPQELTDLGVALIKADFQSRFH